MCIYICVYHFHQLLDKSMMALVWAKLGESHRVLGKHQKWITAEKSCVIHHISSPVRQPMSSSVHQPPQPASSSSSSSSFEQSSFPWSFCFFLSRCDFFLMGLRDWKAFKKNNFQHNTGRPYEGLRTLGGQILTKANHI